MYSSPNFKIDLPSFCRMLLSRGVAYNDKETYKPINYNS